MSGIIMTPELQAEQLYQLLKSFRYYFRGERELQCAIAHCLESAGIAFEREKSLCRRDRVDFMVGTVAIEIKIAGRLPCIVKQLERYASHSEVEALLVVGTLYRLKALPPQLYGKPLIYCHLIYQSF